MRFLLLAHDRSSGRVRLLSERAFDSRSAAVAAAASTASATGLDPTVDEVLAVDLDTADPVLVLRIAQVAGPAAVHDVEAARAAAHEAITSLIATPPAPLEIPRPRIPLFGPPVEEVPEDETLADTLGQVARLMETDLAGWALEEPDRSGEDWDARMLDDYSLPDDGALRETREEGRGLIDSAESSCYCDHAEVRNEFPVSDNDPYTDASVEATAWTGDPAGEPAADVEPMAVAWRDAPEAGPLEAEATVDPGIETQVVPGLGLPSQAWFAPDDSTAEPDHPLQAEPVRDPDGLVDRAALWEPPSGVYRPATADFAVWVCADCVYQRTCRRAGTARPSTCGNFQWRSE